jgi:hypothetical protein
MGRGGLGDFVERVGDGEDQVANPFTAGCGDGVKV